MFIKSIGNGIKEIKTIKPITNQFQRDKSQIFNENGIFISQYVTSLTTQICAVYQYPYHPFVGVSKYENSKSCL